MISTENSRIDKYSQPERRLWYAVILQAIEDYQKDPGRYNIKTRKTIKRYRDTAEFWIFKSKLKSPGSLHWVCENLELDIEAIRFFAKHNKIYRNVIV